MRTAMAVLGVAATGCAQILGLEDPTLGSSVQVDAAPRPDSAPLPDAPPPVTLTVNVTGAGGGRVRSNPTGIDCTDSCMASFAPGTEVTLVAVARGGSSFAGYDIPGCSSDNSCDVTVNSDKTVQVTFSDNSDGHNFIFVTRDFYPLTTFAPLSKADDKCNESAQAAGLPGTYVAWISKSGVNAKDRIPGTTRGWVRPDGLPVLDRLSDLFVNKLYYPPNVSAAGSLVQFEYAVTGTDANGLAVPDRTCADWTSDDPNDRANMLIIAGVANIGETSCQFNQPLLCFGTGKSKIVNAPTRPAGTRLAFSTTTGMPAPLGAIADADAICQSEATAAGIAGTGVTFQALIAPPGASAASRFDDTKGPWVRLDGVVLAYSGTTVFSASVLAAPFSVTAAGGYLNVRRAAGGATSPNVPPTADTNCADWTVTDSSRKYLTAHTNLVRNWFNTFQTGCNEFCNGCLSLICLQK